MNFFSRTKHRIWLEFNQYTKDRKLALAKQDSKLAQIILADATHYSKMSINEQAEILLTHVKDSKILLPKKTDIIKSHKRIVDIAEALCGITNEADKARANAAASVLKENLSLFECLEPSQQIEVLHKYISIPKKSLTRSEKHRMVRLALDHPQAALILFANPQLLRSVTQDSIEIYRIARNILFKNANEADFSADFMKILCKNYNFAATLSEEPDDLITALSYRNIASQIPLRTRLLFALFFLENKNTATAIQIINHFPNLIANFSAMFDANNHELKELVIKFCTLLKEDQFHNFLFQRLSSAQQNSANDNTLIDDLISCCKFANTSITEMLCPSSYQNVEYLNTLMNIGLKDFHEATVLLTTEMGKNVIEWFLNGNVDIDQQATLKNLNELVTKYTNLEGYENNSVLIQTRQFLAPYNKNFIKENCAIMGIPETATSEEENKQYKEQSRKLHPDKVSKDATAFKELGAAHEFLKSALPSKTQQAALQVLAKENFPKIPAGSSVPQRFRKNSLLLHPSQQLATQSPKVNSPNWRFFKSAVKNFFGFSKKAEKNVAEESTRSTMKFT